MEGIAVPERFVFREVDCRDIETFLMDGEVRAKNHPSPQECHQTNYAHLVQRRGTDAFALPGGRVVNDCVAFYFSPLTSFTCAIHRGSVEVYAPSGEFLSMSRREDRAFLVGKVTNLYDAGLECYFSNYALNSTVPQPSVVSDQSQLESHVDWAMFDEAPIAASIPEIGYGGVCKYFHSPAIPKRYHLRKPIRMAEFLVVSAVPMNAFSCIVTPTNRMESDLTQKVRDYGLTMPVLSKPGCFVS